MTDPAEKRHRVDAAAFVESIKPVLDAVGAELIHPDRRSASDIPLTWQGRVIAGVRTAPLTNALDRLIESVEHELGGTLAGLPREKKQLAVRLLNDRGAFVLRRAVEDVADALGVSRITVYNYLNAIHK